MVTVSSLMCFVAISTGTGNSISLYLHKTFQIAYIKQPPSRWVSYITRNACESRIHQSDCQNKNMVFNIKEWLLFETSNWKEIIYLEKNNIATKFESDRPMRL